MRTCQCGAETKGKWADKHSPGCPALGEFDIEEIIEAAAASGDDHGLKLDPPSTTSKVREKAVAHLIFRFLQNCPEDATVMELREAVENSGYGRRP